MLSSVLSMDCTFSLIIKTTLRKYGMFKETVRKVDSAIIPSLLPSLSPLPRKNPLFERETRKEAGTTAVYYKSAWKKSCSGNVVYETERLIGSAEIGKRKSSPYSPLCMRLKEGFSRIQSFLWQNNRPRERLVSGAEGSWYSSRGWSQGVGRGHTHKSIQFQNLPTEGIKEWRCWFILA